MIAGWKPDGFKSIKAVCDPEFLHLAEELEESGRALFPGSMSRDAYIEKNSSRSILFLIDVQRWKNLYFGKPRDFLQLDAPEKIAGTIFDFFRAGSDGEKLQVLAQITRMGPIFDQTSLQKSMMIAQFLDPFDWGMMDWRTLQGLGLSGLLDFTREASAIHPQLFFESTFQRALQVLRAARSERWPRALDVSLGFYFAQVDQESAAYLP